MAGRRRAGGERAGRHGRGHEHATSSPSSTEDLAEGPTSVDPARLELATELLLDVGEWAGDDGPREALAPSQPLGWLVSFIVKPDPTRLAPSPPFDAESAALRGLLDGLEERLNRH